MSEVWLARHGETTWNLAGRYQGRLESALTSLGMAQAQALGAFFFERLARRETVPRRIVSSPLLRCAATADVVAERLGVARENDERLVEISHGGTWEGKLRDQIARDDAERYRAWRTQPASVVFPGGESLADVQARWRSFARELAARDEPTLVLSHDAVIRSALADLLGRSLDDVWQLPVENGAFALLVRREGALAVVEPCVNDHLAGLRAQVSAQAL
ncbi:MAG: histidine phosphatase family protein [Vulcanimicrobiaceae bacterium]